MIGETHCILLNIVDTYLYRLVYEEQRANQSSLIISSSLQSSHIPLLSASCPCCLSAWNVFPSNICLIGSYRFIRGCYWPPHSTQIQPELLSYRKSNFSSITFTTKFNCIFVCLLSFYSNRL